MDGKFFGALGLCARAGKLIYGTPMTVEAMQKGKRIYLVLESCDTSANTHKRINDKCAFYGVEKIQLSDVDGVTLAHAVGKQSSLAVLAVFDEGFYKMISKHLDNIQG